MAGELRDWRWRLCSSYMGANFAICITNFETIHPSHFPSRHVPNVIGDYVTNFIYLIEIFVRGRHVIVYQLYPTAVVSMFPYVFSVFVLF